MNGGKGMGRKSMKGFCCFALFLCPHSLATSERQVRRRGKHLERRAGDPRLDWLAELRCQGLAKEWRQGNGEEEYERGLLFCFIPLPPFPCHIRKAGEKTGETPGAA